jgi:hypothetical protein
MPPLSKRVATPFSGTFQNDSGDGPTRTDTACWLTRISSPGRYRSATSPMVRAAGIEPATSCAQGRRATAALRSDLVGAAGFGPAISCSRSRRDTRLRYTPIVSPSGLEPPPSYEDRVLNPARLPLRHGDMVRTGGVEPPRDVIPIAPQATAAALTPRPPVNSSERVDLNHRSRGPQPRAITRLRYAPIAASEVSGWVYRSNVWCPTIGLLRQD